MLRRERSHSLDSHLGDDALRRGFIPFFVRPAGRKHGPTPASCACIYSWSVGVWVGTISPSGGDSACYTFFMLNALLWIGAGLWIWFMLTFIVNRCFAFALDRREVEEPEEWPSVSIVVPARNEEKGIRESVTSFCEQDYADFEVVVVDDRSADATPRIIEELSERYPRLRVIAGAEPPEGWLGKPHALEQGRKAGTGEWYLFVDADVVYAPDLLRRAVAYVKREKADMLFLAPDFTTGDPLELALISSLYVMGSAVIPLFLAVRSRTKLIAAGGGVFNLVRREMVEASGAFESLKGAVIDDLELGYRVKWAGGRQAGALAGRLIRIRMYEGGLATIRGFTKNTYPGLIRVPWALALPFVLGSIVSLLPYYGFFEALARGSWSLPATISLTLMHAVMAGIAWTFRQPWYLTFLNPLREVGWWWVLFRSWLVYRRRGLVWRGRSYGK